MSSIHDWIELFICYLKVIKYDVQLDLILTLQVELCEGMSLEEHPSTIEKKWKKPYVTLLLGYLLGLTVSFMIIVYGNIYVFSD